MKRNLLRGGAFAAIALLIGGVTGCGSDKTEIPSTFQSKPDKPPSLAGAPAPKGGAKGAGGGATND